MSVVRPVFLTRRFWPRMDGAARTLADLASQLNARGGEATVLTVLEHPQWPAPIQCRGVQVARLPKPTPGRLGEFCYARRIARWLRDHADRYNLVYVSGLRRDARTAIEAVGRRAPIVLRAERAGWNGDCLWQTEARGGWGVRDACMKAAALVAPSRQTQQELIAAFPRSRICSIPHGVPSRPRRTSQTKRIARATLGESHPMLDLPAWAPLALYAGRLHRDKDLARLVAAWRPVVDRWPDARLWLAGEGPERTALLEQIDARRLSDRVFLVGMFDQVDTLLDAADLFVSPSPDEDMSVSLLEAMAAGLPVVACDIPGNRDVATDGRHGILTPPGDAAALSGALLHLFDHPELASAMGNAAQDHVNTYFPLAKNVETHITLFESLLDGKRG